MTKAQPDPDDVLEEFTPLPFEDENEDDTDD